MIWVSSYGLINLEIISGTQTHRFVAYITTKWKIKADRQTGDFPGGVVIGMHLLTSFENICLYLHYQLSNKEKHKI